MFTIHELLEIKGLVKQHKAESEGMLKYYNECLEKKNIPNMRSFWEGEKKIHEEKIAGYNVILEKIDKDLG